MIGAVQNAQFTFLQTKWLGKLFVELCHVQQVAIQSTDRVRIAIGHPRNGLKDLRLNFSHVHLLFHLVEELALDGVAE